MNQSTISYTSSVAYTTRETLSDGTQPPPTTPMVDNTNNNPPKSLSLAPLVVRLNLPPNNNSRGRSNNSNNNNINSFTPLDVERLLRGRVLATVLVQDGDDTLKRVLHTEAENHELDSSSIKIYETGVIDSVLPMLGASHVLIIHLLLVEYWELGRSFYQIIPRQDIISTEGAIPLQLVFVMKRGQKAMIPGDSSSSSIMIPSPRKYSSRANNNNIGNPLLTSPSSRNNNNNNNNKSPRTPNNKKPRISKRLKMISPRRNPFLPPPIAAPNSLISIASRSRRLADSNNNNPLVNKDTEWYCCSCRMNNGGILPPPLVIIPSHLTTTTNTTMTNTNTDENGINDTNHTSSPRRIMTIDMVHHHPEQLLQQQQQTSNCELLQSSTSTTQEKTEIIQQQQLLQSDLPPISICSMDDPLDFSIIIPSPSSSPLEEPNTSTSSPTSLLITKNENIMVEMEDLSASLSIIPPITTSSAATTTTNIEVKSLPTSPLSTTEPIPINDSINNNNITIQQPPPHYVRMSPPSIFYADMMTHDSVKHTEFDLVPVQISRDNPERKPQLELILGTKILFGESGYWVLGMKSCPPSSSNNKNLDELSHINIDIYDRIVGAAPLSQEPETILPLFTTGSVRHAVLDALDTLGPRDEHIFLLVLRHQQQHTTNSTNDNYPYKQCQHCGLYSSTSNKKGVKININGKKKSWSRVFSGVIVDNNGHDRQLGDMVAERLAKELINAVGTTGPKHDLLRNWRVELYRNFPVANIRFLDTTITPVEADVLVKYVDENDISFKSKRQVLEHLARKRDVQALLGDMIRQVNTSLSSSSFSSSLTSSLEPPQQIVMGTQTTAEWWFGGSNSKNTFLTAGVLSSGGGADWNDESINVEDGLLAELGMDLELVPNTNCDTSSSSADNDNLSTLLPSSDLVIESTNTTNTNEEIIKMEIEEEKIDEQLSQLDNNNNNNTYNNNSVQQSFNNELEKLNSLSSDVTMTGSELDPEVIIIIQSDDDIKIDDNLVTISPPPPLSMFESHDDILHGEQQQQQQQQTISGDQKINSDGENDDDDEEDDGEEEEDDEDDEDNTTTQQSTTQLIVVIPSTIQFDGDDDGGGGDNDIELVVAPVLTSLPKFVPTTETSALNLLVDAATSSSSTITQPTNLTTESISNNDQPILNESSSTSNKTTESTTTSNTKPASTSTSTTTTTCARRSIHITMVDNLRFDLFIPRSCAVNNKLNVAHSLLYDFIDATEEWIQNRLQQWSLDRSRRCCLNGVRDAFDLEAVPIISQDDCRRIDWYMHTSQAPEELKSHSSTQEALRRNSPLLPLGVSTYLNVLSEDVLQQVEHLVETMCDKAINGTSEIAQEFPETFHHMKRRGNTVTRTKMFFGARYLWTESQMKEDHAHIARGIRTDVAPLPEFALELVYPALLARGAFCRDNFKVNQIAINIYHTGSDGIGPHFDDESRFALPVVALRIFSDSRLSFGCRGAWAVGNGIFSIPMFRNSALVLHSNTYASSVVKHSVRPVDMSGRSGVVIFREIQQELMDIAHKFEMEKNVRSVMNHVVDSVVESMTTGEEVVGNVSDKVDGSNSSKID
jgi:hypothetical protein